MSVDYDLVKELLELVDERIQISIDANQCQDYGSQALHMHRRDDNTRELIEFLERLNGEG